MKWKMDCGVMLAGLAGAIGKICDKLRGEVGKGCQRVMQWRVEGGLMRMSEHIYVRPNTTCVNVNKKCDCSTIAPAGRRVKRNTSIGWTKWVRGNTHLLVFRVRRGSRAELGGGWVSKVEEPVAEGEVACTHNDEGVARILNVRKAVQVCMSACMLVRISAVCK